MSACFSKLIRRAPQSGHVRRKGFRAAYAFAPPGFSAAQDHATPGLRRAYAVPPPPPAYAFATPPLRRLSAYACAFLSLTGRKEDISPCLLSLLASSRRKCEDSNTVRVNENFSPRGMEITAQCGALTVHTSGRFSLEVSCARSTEILCSPCECLQTFQAAITPRIGTGAVEGDYERHGPYCWAVACADHSVQSASIR